MGPCWCTAQQPRVKHTVPGPDSPILAIGDTRGMSAAPARGRVRFNCLLRLLLRLEESSPAASVAVGGERGFVAAGESSRRSAVRRGRGLRALAAGLVLVVLPVVATIAPPPAAALQRADYPSWDDVVKAQRDEAAAKQLKQQLESQMQALQDEAQRTQDEADAKGVIYAEAQQAYDEQKVVTDSLVAQTEAAQARRMPPSPWPPRSSPR